ncbi:C40 family peptidase [Candidatus Woesearchaeota archaeon]|nr:C40 family peptidase [Candidatus Woesearchaeota archaeon]
MTTTLLETAEQAAPKQELSNVVAFALSLLGAPFISHKELHLNSARHNGVHVSGENYIRHSHTPVNPETGFDCIGFVGYAFEKSIGLHLPRHVVELFCSTNEGYIGQVRLVEVGLNKIMKGDVLFFTRNSPFLPTHVAIYAGNLQILHSSQRNNGVALTPLEEMVPRLLAVKRVIYQA